ncbi:MAG: histidine kinase dimerization/phosphoacceptor domain -containing protein [Spirochaetaceae bacterium]|nr:histidine kinase dimerization/phosphoacceptor domain -containing protein [Spirochaetaceae bacterium]
MAAYRPNGVNPLRRAKDQVEGESGSPADRGFLDAENLRILHELQVHQIELELQNEELKTSRCAVEAGLERYSELFEFAPVGYLVLSRGGSIASANFAASRILRCPRSLLERRSLRSFVAPESLAAFAGAMEKVFSGEERLAFELSLRFDGGEKVFVQTEALSRDRGQSCFLAMTDISERKHSEEALAASLESRAVLFLELQHRVKNNLNVIGSLLEIGTRAANDPGARQVLVSAQARVYSIAAIYERLYLSGGCTEVELAPYIERLAAYLCEAYAVDKGRIALVMELDQAKLDIDRGMTLGLILNELISNAIKYAYPEGSSGVLRVRLKKTPASLALTVADCGTGMPTGLDPATTPTMGLTLVRLLSAQIRAEYRIESGKGVSVEVVLAS